MSAIHTTGDGYSYAGIGFDLNNGSETAESAESMSFDASKFDGLVFYAKGTGKWRVEFPTKNFVPKDKGGACDGSCWNVYGDRSLQGTLASSWTEYKIPFSKLVRESGDAKPAFDPSQLMGIAFKHEASDKFDFWLDDLRFYKDGGTSQGSGSGGSGGRPGMSSMGGASGMASGPTSCSFNDQPYANAGYTWYMFSQGTYKDPDTNLFQTACGHRSTAQGAETVANIGTPQYFAAIASESDTNFSTKQYCGACAQIKNGNKTLVVTIVDSCPRKFANGSNPKCTDGHLDLSKAANDYLGLSGDVSGAPPWKLVPCPVSGNIVVRVKPGNENQVYIENAVLPFQSVKMNGMEAKHLDYGAWQVAGNAAGATLTLTDIAGRSVDVKVTGSAGENKDGGAQLPMCK